VAVIELNEQTIIDQVADRLTRKYPTIPPDTLSAVVQGVHARFDGRPVREYVPPPPPPDRPHRPPPTPPIARRKSRRCNRRTD